MCLLHLRNPVKEREGEKELHSLPLMKIGDTLFPQPSCMKLKSRAQSSNHGTDRQEVNSKWGQIGTSARHRTLHCESSGIRALGTRYRCKVGWGTALNTGWAGWKPAVNTPVLYLHLWSMATTWHPHLALENLTYRNSDLGDARSSGVKGSRGWLRTHAESEGIMGKPAFSHPLPRWAPRTPPGTCLSPRQDTEELWEK